MSRHISAAEESVLRGDRLEGGSATGPDQGGGQFDDIRVLHVINRLDDSSGTEFSLVQLLPYLNGDGFRHAVLPLLENRTASPLAKRGIRVYDAPGVTGVRGVRHVSAAVGDFRPSLVHSSLFDADLTARLAVRRRVPLISSIVGVPYSEAARSVAPSPRRLEIIRQVEGWLARRVNVAFHAVTEAAADEAVRALRIPRERIFVIPRGRDRERLGERSPERRSRVRASLGLAMDSPVVLNVARHVPLKGQGLLIEAFATVLKQRPDAVLLIAGGPGPSTPELQSACQLLGFGDRVRLLGVRDDVPDLLCAADVLAFPSLAEGIGGAVIEAMAMSTPVVAFDVPAVREVLDGSGCLVPPGDVKALAAVILDVLSDPGAARVDDALTRFEKYFALDVVASRMRRMYLDIARSLDGRRTVEVGRSKG